MKKESSALGHIRNMAYHQMMLVGLLFIIAATLYQHIQSLGFRKQPQ